jgi:hypothetical protein
MNNLPDLVRESLTDLTDAATMPPGLGERAMTAGKRRRRRQTALVGVAAGVAVAAVVLPFAVLPRGGAPAPATARADNVLFAVRHTEYLATSDRESDVHRWEVLDPVTGDYRDVLVKYVSEPTTDLRYAAVLPKGDGAQTPSKVGRYETTTGALRWYDIPVRPDFAAISPDGRYAAARGWDDAAQAADIAVVDLETGQVRRFNTAHLYVRVVLPTPPAGSPEKPALPRVGMAMFDERTQEIAWAPDSRHLLFGAAVTDLDGRQTGELARPDETGVVSVHRDGAGTLIRTGLEPTDYAVVDGTGAVLYGRADGDWTCETTVPPVGLGRCGKPWSTFLSWRGREQVLIQTGPDPYAQAGTGTVPPTTTPPVEEATYVALDLRTGHREAVSVPRFDGDGSDGDIAHSFVVVISAEGLPPAVRDRLAF